MPSKFVSLLLCTLLLTQCGGSVVTPTEETELPNVSGAKSAIYGLELLLNYQTHNRPTAPMGIFSSTFLAQGVFLPVQGALRGVGIHLKLIEGQSTPDTDDTFALLQEFGSVLQVDIVDALNRSDSRAKTLDRYIQTLRNIGILAERKKTELDALLDNLGDQKREERRAVQSIERTIRDALNKEDYTTAGANQKELTDAKSSLAETETREEQTADILERFEELLEVAENRLDAIDKNRQILISGLKVVEVPGIDDLRILEDGPRRRSGRNSTSIFDL